MFADYIYEGLHNPLMFIFHISIPIYCKYDLVLYPFDTTKCEVELSLQNVVPGSVAINIAEKNLKVIESSLRPSEYHIGKYSLNQEGRNFSLAFNINRYSKLYLVTTFLPTGFLHLIGYGTLTLNPDNFQDRGTMSLTTLLVLISLYTDTSVALPKTPYIKLIDIWYIFSISFISLIITVHLLTSNNLSEVKSISSSKVSPKYTKNSFFKTVGAITNRKVLNICKVIFAVVYGIFIFIFFYSCYFLD